MSQIKNAFNSYSVGGLNHAVQEEGELGHRLNHVKDANDWNYDMKFHHGEDTDMANEVSEWPEDERTYTRVCEALFRDGVIASSDVDIEVDNGVVTLTGEVSDRHAKKYADEKLDNLYGVIKVINNLTLKRDRGLIGRSDGWPV